jgi:P-type conjugative transfer protein TrbG
MNKKLFFIALAAGLHGLAVAQQVPAIESSNIQSTYMPSGFVASTSSLYNALPMISPDTVKLNAKEETALRLSNQWKARAVMPAMGDNGTVNFVYGATLPSVVCAPLYACDVSLQPGEIVSQVDVGDAPRWKVTPANSGTAENPITHLVIKPSDAGLTTNMLVHTDRRTYNIRLVSKKTSWMGSIAFSYPDDADAQWAAYRQQHQQQAAIQGSIHREVSPTVANSTLNFNYRVKGDDPHWKPIRVYSDHNKTYIQFPENAKNTEIPALVVLGPGNQEQLVNYRMVDDRYVVDKVIDKAALITGVGRRQQRVNIQRVGS